MGKLRPWDKLAGLRVSSLIETQCSLVDFSCELFVETPSPAKKVVLAVKERKAKAKTS